MTDSPKDDARVEVIERATPYSGYFRVDSYKLRHRKHDGGWTPVLSRELFERGHTAVVLPYDPVRDAVVLVEQFRIGAYAAGHEPWLIEAVAGSVEPGEAPEDVVRREVQEEAGCAVTELVAIGAFLLSPGGSSETSAMFCGRVDSEGVGGIHGLDHEDEDIRAVVIPAEEAIAKVMSGEIVSGYGVIPLLWLALNRDDLRRRWR